MNYSFYWRNDLPSQCSLTKQIPNKTLSLQAPITYYVNFILANIPITQAALLVTGSTAIYITLVHVAPIVLQTVELKVTYIQNGNKCTAFPLPSCEKFYNATIFMALHFLPPQASSSSATCSTVITAAAAS